MSSTSGNRCLRLGYKLVLGSGGSFGVALLVFLVGIAFISLEYTPF